MEKLNIFDTTKIDILLVFAQTIDCGYTLDLYFWIKNKKNRYTPVYPSFTI